MTKGVDHTFTNIPFYWPTPPTKKKKSEKHPNLVAAEHGENVTILSIENAVGSVIWSDIFFKGQRMVGEWLDALPPWSIAQMTSCGSMTTEAFVNLLTHFSRYKCAGPAYWYLTVRHDTRIISQWTLHTAMIFHYYTFQVRLLIELTLWTNLSLDHVSINWMNWFFCSITTSQIALSPSRNLARFSLKHRIKQPHQTTLKRDSVLLTSVPSTPRLLPTNVCSLAL